MSVANATMTNSGPTADAGARIRHETRVALTTTAAAIIAAIAAIARSAH